MSPVFPFDQPASTLLYLVLFVATLVVHFLFMSYVLAGSVWIMAGQFRSQGRSSEITRMLGDWMPVMLSGAITAGVAPLLFIQILYRQQFYTANLLQFNRWMAILPVLIALFYLAYLIKSHGDRRSLAQRVASVVCVAGVLFVAWSWSGNHELSLQPPEIWQQHYAGSATAQQKTLVSLRLGLWITMTFPVLCCLLTWQLRHQNAVNQPPPGIARTSAVAICGTILSVVMALLIGRELPDSVGDAVMSRQGAPWLIIAAIGLLVQLSGWGMRFRRRIDTAATRWLVSLGILLQLTGVMMTRELLRVVRLGDRIDYSGHGDAATADGLWLFLVFCVVNACIAAWCIGLVRRSAPSSDE